MGSSEVEGTCPWASPLSEGSPGNRSLCSGFWPCSLSSRCYLCPKLLGAQKPPEAGTEGMVILWWCLAHHVREDFYVGAFLNCGESGEKGWMRLFSVWSRGLYCRKWALPATLLPGILLSPYSKPLFINIHAPVHKHIHPSNVQSGSVSTKINTQRRNMTETDGQRSIFNFLRKHLLAFGAETVGSKGKETCT